MLIRREAWPSGQRVGLRREKQQTVPIKVPKNRGNASAS